MGTNSSKSAVQQQTTIVQMEVKAHTRVNKPSIILWASLASQEQYGQAPSGGIATAVRPSEGRVMLAMPVAKACKLQQLLQQASSTLNLLQPANWTTLQVLLPRCGICNDELRYTSSIFLSG
jgi:hypothetical protein